MIVDKKHIHLVEDSSIHEHYYGSDHCPIKISVNLNKLKQIKEHNEDETIYEFDESEMKEIFTEAEDENDLENAGTATES